MPIIIPQDTGDGGGGGGGPGTDDQTATEVPYSNTASGLTGTNCQTAIDELSASAYIQDITVNTAYTILAGDDLILVDHSAAIIIKLPAVPEEHKTYIIKDKSGDASSFNITVNGNGNIIDGSATFTISSNYGAFNFIYDGVDWNVF